MEALVDINIAVYNQKPYLENTLASVLNQKTDFPFRLLIGDDCSTDGSIEILKRYETKYSDKIKIIYQPKNLGFSSIERNGIILLKNSIAKYIAFLDGDDYWNDPNKLQTQVNFLESHPEYSGCFHNAEERYDAADAASFLYCKFPSARRFSFADLCYENPIPTCSVMFRNVFSKEGLPDWFGKLKMGDWPIYLLSARFGDFWYMPKIMAVHRLHQQGMWGMQDHERNKKFILEAYNIMIEAFAGKEPFGQQLMDGKEAFVASGKPKSYYKRAANSLKRLVDRL